MPANPLARCHQHPTRPPFARCMSCAKMLCQECATQWEGIWHCAACLGAKRGARVQRPAKASTAGVVVLSLILLYCSARVMVWTGALIAGLF